MVREHRRGQGSLIFSATGWPWFMADYAALRRIVANDPRKMLPSARTAPGFASATLLVIGRQGEDRQSAADQVGSQLESVIRVMHRPVLVTPAEFLPPRSLMLAFDASATTRKGVAMLAASPLIQGMPVHLVMVGADSGDNRTQLEDAARLLQEAGLCVTSAIRCGEIEPALHAYQAEHDIDLLVMGAYGHSRIREFLIGSTTASMLRSTHTPLLMLR